jgi:hypothetical protein
MIYIEYNLELYQTGKPGLYIYRKIAQWWKKYEKEGNKITTLLNAGVSIHRHIVCAHRPWHTVSVVTAPMNCENVAQKLSKIHRVNAQCRKGASVVS